jgi:hypothetical protein
MVPGPNGAAPVPLARPGKGPKTRRKYSGTLVVAALAGLGLLAAGVAFRLTHGGAYAVHVQAFAAPGQATLVHRTERRMVHASFFDPERLEIVRNTQSLFNDEEIWTETVLETGDPRPRKYQRVYEKAVRGTKSILRARSYQGRTVLFELREDQYHISVGQDPPLDPSDLEELALNANGGRAADLTALFVTARSVRIGEHWFVNPHAIARLFPPEVELDQTARGSGGEATLARVYRREGKTHGVLEANLHLAMMRRRKFRFDNNPAQIQANATVEGVLDGSEPPRKAEIRIRLQGHGWHEEGHGARVQLMTDTELLEERTLESERPGLAEQMGQVPVEASGKWKQIRALDGQFSVCLPSTVQETLEGEPDGYFWQRLAAESEEGWRYVYEVSYTDQYPGASANEAAKILDTVAGKKVNKAGTWKKIVLSGSPGLEVVGEAASHGGALTATYRFYVVGTRVYFLMAGQAKGREKPAEAARFLDSFTLRSER